MAIKFQSNEKSYLSWTAKNPDGYVINTRLSDDPKYMVLHRASCDSIHKYKITDNDCDGFTEKKYIKICSETISDLSTWIKKHGRPDGSFSKACGLCKPFSN